MAETPVMKVFYGPPGTGKTYRAAREAVRIVTGRAPPNDRAAMAEFSALMNDAKIWWVTFHPSYTYEDFVEGFRPKLTEEKQLYYEVEPGPFKLACRGAEAPAKPIRHNIAVGEVLRTNKDFEVIRADENAVTVRSHVTRKDAVATEKEEVIAIDLLEKFRAAKIRPDELSYSGQRHQERADVARRAGIPVTTLTATGPIRAVYARYLEGPPQARLPAKQSPVVLVIDEINRADLSRVFGELITLLEVDKRQGSREERRVFLPYSKSWFMVPPTLSVIGTMNTADRSLALMDFALRRRFEFEEVAPDPRLCPAAYGGVDVRALLDSWNDRITILRSRDHRIGHAELMEEKLESVRETSPEGWRKSKDGELRALARTIRVKIVPTLLEYFHEDWHKCRAVLGPADANLMVERQPLDGDDYYADLTDVSESRGFELTDWWDPASGKWDADTLRSTLGRTSPGRR